MLAKPSPHALISLTRSCKLVTRPSFHAARALATVSAALNGPSRAMAPLSAARRGPRPRVPWIGTRSMFDATIQRDPRFSRLSEQDMAYFLQVLGEAGVITDRDTLAPMNRDWLGNWGGSSKLALRPATTEELSQVLGYCNRRRLAVVPQGGNTGLVGGGVPLFDEIILSLARMNRIIGLDEFSGVVTCEAGVVLEALQNYLDERGFIMPLDLGAKGSCMVGGNAATNAGGIRFVKYGSLRGTILGMEAVLPDGRVLDTLTNLRKDNTGYDLKQLFIGAEGSLGVITKLAILAARKPKSVHVAFLGVESYENVLETLRRARADLSDVLSAIEFLDRNSMELVTNQLPGCRDPLSAPYPFYVLIETSGSNADHDAEKLNQFLETIMSANQTGPPVAADGTVAQDMTQIKSLWRLREGISEALNKAGAVYKYDISLPTAQMYQFVEDMRNRLGSSANVVGYGHLGDGNLHLNVSVPKHTDEVFQKIEPFLFEQIATCRGSVSAEHGLGQCKVKYLHFSKPTVAIDLMQQIKSLFDPNHILNPYKVLPPADATHPASTSTLA